MIKTVEYRIGMCHGTTTINAASTENDAEIIERVKLRVLQTLNIEVDSCRVLPEI